MPGPKKKQIFKDEFTEASAKINPAEPVQEKDELERFIEQLDADSESSDPLHQPAVGGAAKARTSTAEILQRVHIEESKPASDSDHDDMILGELDAMYENTMRDFEKQEGEKEELKRKGEMKSRAPSEDEVTVASLYEELGIPQETELEKHTADFFARKEAKKMDESIKKRGVNLDDQDRVPTQTEKEQTLEEQIARIEKEIEEDKTELERQVERVRGGRARVDDRGKPSAKPMAGASELEQHYKKFRERNKAKQQEQTGQDQTSNPGEPITTVKRLK